VGHPLFTALLVQRPRALVLAGSIFALGFAAGVMVRPQLPAAAWASPTASVPAPARPANGTSAAEGLTAKASLPLGYPAEVIRVIDGDTFAARVRVWPGLDVTTKVRLRNIDAPELHARCPDELSKAQAARAALEQILAAGTVTVSQVGIDKYGGRVDALVATREVADVSAALLNGGWARPYDGGRRRGWC
jgi:endonuclease YncB( thermonuclease family)